MALQAEHSTSPTPFLEIPESIEIPLRLDNNKKVTKGRQRANSKVYGNGSTSTVLPSPSPALSNMNKSSSNNTANQPNGTAKTSNDSKDENKVAGLLPQRENFVYILVLTSTNGTFDRKTLEIPHFPEVLKLGRPNSSQKAPDPRNGYFDSRVISREHAQLTIKDGKIVIDDLNSANGTFLNGVKILKEHSLKKNDTVELGVNIDNDNNNKHHHHRRISCLVTEILTLPLDSASDESKLFEELAKLDSKLGKSTKETKELSAFDAAMFGDITEDLDDVALGISHDFLTGIFVNNNIGTNDNLVRSIRSLINQVHLERVNNLKLASVEKLLDTFKTQLTSDEDVLRYQKYKKENDRMKIKMDEITRELSKQTNRNNENEIILKKSNDLVNARNNEVRYLKETLKLEKEMTSKLTEQIEDLGTLIHSKDVHISNLQDESFMNNGKYEEELKELQLKLEQRENKIFELELEKEKELAKISEQEVLYDIFRLGYIVLFVVTVGGAILRWF